VSDAGKRRLGLRASTQRLASPFARLPNRREEDSGPVTPFEAMFDANDYAEEPEAPAAVLDLVPVTRHGRSPLPFDRRVCVYLRSA
jgi:hypothetical protein